MKLDRPMTDQLKPVAQLLIGLICIFIVIWGLVPFALQHMQTEVMQMIQEKEMNTSALFYSDSEEALEANFEMIKEK